MSGKVITYESLDDKIVPEALTRDNALGLDIVDGHAVKNPGDYEDPDKLFDMLIARIRRYHPTKDVSKVESAYKIAKAAHEGISPDSEEMKKLLNEKIEMYRFNEEVIDKIINVYGKELKQ